MKFSKLRLLGFKSFVEPTEFLIENGLTGIVGPNGCGKSNLVEALRWVMGESSYKNMRATAMDDVVFSGSANRPARNIAEVSLFLDNSDKSGPPAYHDAEEIQISRRIEREQGSAYRINGREARAKDVQLLFADASTGARSPSMVGQGRISELIAAKPKARRALLEEAAGISGLHTRRHEAELRLRAAEQNLERLEDVVSQLESQRESLKRQGRQARRFKSLSEDIRKTEAIIYHLRWKMASDDAKTATERHNSAIAAVGAASEQQASAAKDQAIVAHKLPALRENQAKAAAALQRMNIAKTQLEEEVNRLSRRKSELESRLAQQKSDMQRETATMKDAQASIADIKSEYGKLGEQNEENVRDEQQSLQQRQEAESILDSREAEFAAKMNALAGKQAQAQSLSAQLENQCERKNSLSQKLERFENELQQLQNDIDQLPGTKAKQQDLSAIEAEIIEIDSALKAAEIHTREAIDAEREGRQPLAEARAKLTEIEAEIRTLSAIVNSAGQDLFAPIVNQIKVEPGYEVALGAALGEDLDVTIDRAAPVHFTMIEAGGGDPQLPPGIDALSQFLSAPEELARRLSQIGICEEAKAKEVQPHLKPGQCLVSKAGEIWRWDGYVASADAPTAAALKLEQKNRLEELDRAAERAKRQLNEAEGRANHLKSREEQARIAEGEIRKQQRELQSRLAQAQRDLAEAEKSVSHLASRKLVVEDNIKNLQEQITECQNRIVTLEEQTRDLEDLDALRTQLETFKTELVSLRGEVAQKRAAHENIAQKSALRNERLAQLTTDLKRWQNRFDNSELQITELQSRILETQSELEKASDAPEQFTDHRRKLDKQIDEASQAKKAADTALSDTEGRLSAADSLAKQRLDELTKVREEAARAEERAHALSKRLGELEAEILREMECQLHQVKQLAQIEEGADLPPLVQVEKNLEKHKNERERLGGVNLRAEQELEEIESQIASMTKERDDLIQAIAKLRHAIGSLNKEGRQKLLAAFDAVNEHFQQLFLTLFGGGSANLEMIESDDPLESGLEIMARPPGKKPQAMTLLSGGEQALTAMALIFAVFLTNPAPICVLDEVDAPLDDHNIERFCNLMDQMTKKADTRFVLITHNPITMSRMDRLFGVTMAERGVSQLVSVDLGTAKTMRDIA